MDPKQLLQALMKRDKDNPHSLAEKLKQKTGQPQIYKFLNGVAKEPRRSTLQPVADFYGISVEAFYDPLVADIVMQNLEAGRPLTDTPNANISATPEASSPPAEPNQHQPAAASGVLENLRLLLLQADPADRSAAGSLLSGLANNPENPRLLSALATMLGDLADARPMPVAEEIERSAKIALPPITMADAEKANLMLRRFSDSLKAKPNVKKRKES